MRKRLRSTVLALTVIGLLGGASSASAQGAQETDTSFKPDIEKLLQATGAAQAGLQMAAIISKQMFDTMNANRPDLPPRAFEIAQDVLTSEFGKAFEGSGGLSEQLVQLYANHFTHDEIRGLLAFYESPVGRKAVQELPALIQESAGAGQQWAQKQMPIISAQIEKRLREEGIIK